MKITRQQVLDIYNVLLQFKSEKVDASSAFNISFNRKLAQKEFDVLNEAREQTKIPAGLEEWEEERIQTCKLFAEKDEEGVPKKIRTPDGREVFDIKSENLKTLEEKLKEIKEEKYKETFEESDKIEESFKKLLEEELDIGFRKIKVSGLPNVSADQIDILEPILEADE